MLGLGVDLNGGSFTSFVNEEIAIAFSQRVEADGGIFEALQCLINTIDSL